MTSVAGDLIFGLGTNHLCSRDTFSSEGAEHTSRVAAGSAAMVAGVALKGVSAVALSRANASRSFSSKKVVGTLYTVCAVLFAASAGMNFVTASLSHDTADRREQMAQWSMAAMYHALAKSNAALGVMNIAAAAACELAGVLYTESGSSKARPTEIELEQSDLLNREA